MLSYNKQKNCTIKHKSIKIKDEIQVQNKTKV